VIDRPATISGPIGASAGADPVPMTELEIAWGWVAGAEELIRLPVSSAPPPLRAFEDAIRPALQRPPCLVEFSGGRDSSAVLAVAVSLSQREGHAPPIPVTQRFPGVAEADEDQWQEKLVRQLGLTEWLRRDVFDEIDLIGPVAAASLRRHGMVWPPLAHVRGFIWDLARGGSVLTGEGGDEILGPRRLTPVRQVLARDVRPTRRNLRAAALCVAPERLRSRALRASMSGAIDAKWLSPSAREGLVRAAIRPIAEESVDRRRALAQHLSSRGMRISLHNMAVMASCFDVLNLHPMLDRGFVAAFAAVARLLGPRDRTAAMHLIFGDLLPDDLLGRRSKARFNRVHFGVHSRDFVESFTGEGVDEDLVDIDALLEVWRTPAPHAMTSALLQASWLATSGGRS
jgi:Asparagine synthase